jgi:hypothetical protein
MLKQILAIIFFVSPIVAYCTHIRAGQIRVTSTDGLKCRIEMRILTNTASDIRTGEGVFSFGDGSTLTTGTKENTPVPGQPGVGLVVYIFEHTYAAAGTYILSYLEPNLNGGILNVPNSVETRFYIEASVGISPTVSYSSPNFPTEPIIFCPSRRSYSFSTAAIDDSAPNNFYYKYSLITPKKEKNQIIGGYIKPENLTINQDNGIVTWDTKFNGEYVAGMFWITVRIDKYLNDGTNLGYVERATEIIVEDSDSKIDLTSSVSAPNNSLIITEGQERKIKVILSDKNTVAGLRFDLYRSIVIKDNISITQYDSASGDQKLRVAILTLKTTSNVLSDLPYPITLSGYASYRIDITFLFRTRDIPLPPPPPVVVGLVDQEILRVYPNPFRSEIYVEGIMPAEATFVNSLGQVVMRSSLHEGGPVNTTNLPAGFYLLRVIGRDGIGRMFKVVRD